MALCLLLELSVQRGSLSHVLSSVLLLLNLWNNSCQESDNRINTGLNCAPLIRLLERFQAIKGSKSRVYWEQRKLEEVGQAVYKSRMLSFIYLSLQFLHGIKVKGKWLFFGYQCKV